MDVTVFVRCAFLVGPYFFTAAGLALCLCLFVSVRRDIQRLHTRVKQSEASAGMADEDLLTRLQGLLARLNEVEQCASLLVPPPPPRSGLNLSARTQAIRLFRRGDDPRHIATVLGLPRNEIELLIKVHQLAVNGGTRVSEPPAAV